VFLDQILRRQEEYIKRIGPVVKPVQKKPARIRKAQSTLKVVPALIVTEPEIEQVEVVEELEPVLEPVLEPEIALISPQLIPAYIEPTDEELKELEEIEQPDSGVFVLDEPVPVPALAFPDLASIFEKYVPKAKGAMAKVGAKMVGLPVPDSMHARMVKFLETNKDKPGAPTSLKDLGLMCVGYALDTLETSPIGGE
jgi:hypothetical protein